MSAWKCEHELEQYEGQICHRYRTRFMGDGMGYGIARYTVFLVCLVTKTETYLAEFGKMEDALLFMQAKSDETGYAWEHEVEGEKKKRKKVK